MAATLEIVERRSGPVTLLELAGDLVAHAGNPFREHIMTLISAGQTGILLDLSRVTSLDSGGVGALVAMYTHVSRRGGRLKLLGLTSRMHRALQITRLLPVFETFEDEDEAVRSFAMPPITPAPVREYVRAS
jgi:anti-anti-sigma factor